MKHCSYVSNWFHVIANYASELFQGMLSTNACYHKKKKKKRKERGSSLLAFASGHCQQSLRSPKYMRSEIIAGCQGQQNEFLQLLFVTTLLLYFHNLVEDQSRGKSKYQAAAPCSCLTNQGSDHALVYKLIQCYLNVQNFENSDPHCTINGDLLFACTQFVQTEHACKMLDASLRVQWHDRHYQSGEKNGARKNVLPSAFFYRRGRRVLDFLEKLRTWGTRFRHRPDQPPPKLRSIEHFQRQVVAKVRPQISCCNPYNKSDLNVHL